MNLFTILDVLLRLAEIGVLLVASAAGLKLHKFLKLRAEQEKLFYARDLVRTVVVASEQLADSGAAPRPGMEKKAVAVNELKNKLAPLGIKGTFVEMLIESIVRDEFHWGNKTKKEEDTPVAG